MTKNRKNSANSKSHNIEKEEKSELVKEKISSTKIPMDIKSIILSGSKYLYIIAAAALLSGIIYSSDNRCRMEHCDIWNPFNFLRTWRWNMHFSRNQKSKNLLRS